MKTILIDNPEGFQELLDIGPGGNYGGPPASIVWDTSKDGPLPADVKAPGKFHGWAKQGNALVVNAGKINAYNAKIAAETAAKNDKANKAAARVAVIKTAKTKPALTLAEVRDILIAIGEHFGIE